MKDITLRLNRGREDDDDDDVYNPSQTQTETQTQTQPRTFITSNPNPTTGKPDEEATRCTIRKHVMRGKNRRKQPAKVSVGSWMNGQDTGTSKATRGQRQQSDTSSASSWSDRRAAFYAAVMKLPRRRPESLFTDANTLHATSMRPLQPGMLQLILNYFTVLAHSFYPIELCLAFDPRHSFWFEYLALDAVYVHTLLCAAQSYFGSFKGGGGSDASQSQLPASLHEQQTHALLRQRLGNLELATSDSTIAVVAILAMLNLVRGDIATARKHLVGLRQIVALRGGVRELKSNTQLQIKVCRADLSIATATGHAPFFFTEGISWKPFLATSSDVGNALSTLQDFSVPGTANSDSSPQSESSSRPVAVSSKLAGLYADLRAFTSSANLAFQTPQKIDPELFQEALISIHYRLILLDPSMASSSAPAPAPQPPAEPWSSFNEALRLGLLAFSASVFLQIEGVKRRFTHLVRRLEVGFSKDQWRGERARDSEIWLFFVAGLTAKATQADEWPLPSLRSILDNAGLTSWSAVRSILKTFLWVDFIHDVQGKRIYEQVVSANLKGLG